MVRVAVGILHRDGQILLCQRKRSARYPLKWEFPGGKIEQDETPPAGLKRELHEELAIDATIGDLFEQQHSLYPDSGSFDVYYYIISSFTGEILNRVFETTAWVPVNHLADYDILEGNREITQKIIRQYGYSGPR